MVGQYITKVVLANGDGQGRWAGPVRQANGMTGEGLRAKEVRETREKRSERKVRNKEEVPRGDRKSEGERLGDVDGHRKWS